MFKIQRKRLYNQAARTLGGLGLSNRSSDVSKPDGSVLQLRPLVALDVLEAPLNGLYWLSVDLALLEEGAGFR